MTDFHCLTWHGKTWMEMDMKGNLFKGSLSASMSNLFFLGVFVAVPPYLFVEDSDFKLTSYGSAPASIANLKWHLKFIQAKSTLDLHHLFRRLGPSLDRLGLQVRLPLREGTLIGLHASKSLLFVTCSRIFFEGHFKKPPKNTNKSIPYWQKLRSRNMG